MVVNAGLGDAGRASDVVHRTAVEAAFGEDPEGDVGEGIDVVGLTHYLTRFSGGPYNLSTDHLVGTAQAFSRRS